MRDQGLERLQVLRDERNLVELVARPDGTQAVRKTLPAPEEYAQERSALVHAVSSDQTVSAVSLLDADDDAHVLLMTLAPGRRLDDGWPQARPDAEITADLARAMRALWGPPAPDAVPLRQWMRALWRPVPVNTVLSQARLDRAAAEAEELLAEPVAPVQLHADLHHENVFRTDDGHLTVIDPKGIAGHSGFDTVAQIWNPFAVTRQPDVARLMATRLDVIAEVTGLDRDLIRAWIRVGCILSAAWYFEDGPEPDAESLRHAADCVRIAELVGRS